MVRLDIQKKAGAIFAHPIVLALPFFLILIFTIPYNFPKFQAQIVNEAKIFQGAIEIWDDLEGDGISDRFNFINSVIGKASVAVFLNPSGFVNTWELYGHCPFIKDRFIITGDYDNNRRKEIYIFTLSNDSIFLHGISDFHNQQPWISKRFITKVGWVDNKTDVEVISGEMEDLNSDGYKELLFVINTGFSIFPRNIFAYDIHNDSLVKSPESGFQITGIVQEDINADGKAELLLEGYSPGNMQNKYPQIPYNDSSCWMMVLDSHLKFMFLPVEFPCRAGSIFPVSFSSGHSTTVSFIYANNKQDNNPCFYKFTCHGRFVLKRKVTEFSKDSRFFTPFIMEDDKNRNIVLPCSDGFYYVYDTSFNFIEKRSLGLFPSSHPFFIDVDQDGKKEIIFPVQAHKQLAIFRNDLSDPAVIDAVLDLNIRTNLSIRYDGKGTSTLFIRTGNYLYLISYFKNPFYYYAKWGFYLAVYLAVLLFTLLIRKIQRIQIQKRYNIEKKITELQLKIVRNQMDPHFTMNALNSVIGAVNKNDKETASKNLIHFAQMYRSLVLSAEKYMVTIQEEISFTKNYIKLEQFRFKEDFNYEIHIDESVKLDWIIPKMIIHNFVENAIKHGLSGKAGKKELKIDLSKNSNQLVICIIDNGIGRTQAAQLDEKSTGKGLQMMAQFLNLYYQITKVKILHEIFDLKDEDGNSLGTKVRISIPIPVE